MLKRQLGHSSLEQTMKYADYHPAYSDLSGYFGELESRLQAGPGPEEGEETDQREASPAPTNV